MKVTDLRDDLIRVYSDLRDKKIGIQEARGLANVSGKIKSTAKTQIEYNKMTGNKDKIEFLEV